MGRPKKASTVKQRTVYVYVPSTELGEEWKHAAERVGVSLSTFVQEAMEFYLARDAPLLAKETLQGKYQESLATIDALHQEHAELHRKLERMETLLDRYEKQLRDLENKRFLSDATFTGIRQYSRRLIELFKKESYLTEEMILDLLHIPPSDVDSIKAIDTQINHLLQYGVIQPRQGGYVWKG